MQVFRNMFRIRQPVGQQRQAAAIDCLNNTGSKKIVMRGDRQDVCLPEPTCIVGKVVCITNMQKVLLEFIKSLIKDGWVLTVCFSEDYNPEVQTFFMKNE